MTDALYIDELKLYFGDDIQINEYIKIHPPSVGEIVDYGEQEYYSMIHCLTAIPSDMKSRLFDIGIDYEEISDFDFFYLMTRGLTIEQTSLLFYDLDFQSFEMFVDKDNGKHVMFNNNFVLDELAYLKIVKCLRMLHSIKPKVEKAANKRLVKASIAEKGVCPLRYPCRLRSKRCASIERRSSKKSFCSIPACLQQSNVAPRGLTISVRTSLPEP